MRLKDLLRGLKYEPESQALLDLDINDVTCRSQEAGPGVLFAALKGSSSDGHSFVPRVMQMGTPVCLADISHRSDSWKGFPVIWVENPRKSYAAITARLFDYPSTRLRLHGVTGTNGKTTTAFLLQHILQSDSPCGMIGTIWHQIGSQQIVSRNTTPDAYELNWMLDRMTRIESEHCVMEVSSHGLDQNRVGSQRFETAIFMNLTHEHLDYHENMEKYFQAKKKLFLEAPLPERSLICMDDPYGEILKTQLGGRAFGFGWHSDADFRISNADFSLEGLDFIISYKKHVYNVRSKLVGAHNLHNLTAAFASALLAGVKAETILRKIQEFPGVPGRMMRVPLTGKVHCFVDYAHTPSAVEGALKTMRIIAAGRIWAILGCGGDRDRSKRPEMGRIGAIGSDFLILTSDNPRSEDPDAILDEIRKGVPVGRNVQTFVDRCEAIKQALSQAEAGDVVLILGKGHENSQILGTQRIPFNDADVAQEVWKGLSANVLHA